jgi:hypothetical protein
MVFNTPKKEKKVNRWHEYHISILAKISHAISEIAEAADTLSL